MIPEPELAARWPRLAREEGHRPRLPTWTPPDRPPLGPRLLAMIRQDAPISTARLASRSAANACDVGEALTRLEADGLVRSRPRQNGIGCVWMPAGATERAQEAAGRGGMGEDSGRAGQGVSKTI